MFNAFFDAIAWLLSWYYSLPVIGGSYGMAIVMLTLTVMVVLTPLTIKGTRSMMTMTALAPEMKRIQQEFADDRVRMNEELLAFYRENKINPLGGCLPLLLQMPVFIILWQVLNGLTRPGENGGFDPKYLSESSALYQALVAETDQTMVSWGLDLARSAAQALQVSFVEGLPYLVLIILVAGTSYLQQKQMTGRNPNAEIPQQQKILLRILPVFFAFISFSFAAALVVYFFVSNLFRIAQQAYISKSLYGISGLAAVFGGGTPTKLPAPPDRPEGSKAGGQGKSSGDKGPAKPPGQGGRSGATKGSRSSSPPKKGTGQPKKPPSGRVTPAKGSEAASRPHPQRRRKKRG